MNYIMWTILMTRTQRLSDNNQPGHTNKNDTILVKWGLERVPAYANSL